MRYRLALNGLIGVVGLLLLTTAVRADDWLPIDPAELASKSEPKAPAAPAIFLYRQVDRNDEENFETVYLRIKILTDEGRKYANVEIPYNRNYEGVGFIRARTIRPDGSIAEFNGQFFDKPIVQGNGRKLMAKTFTMSDVQVGAIVEYRYRHTLRSGYVSDSHWILSDELYTKHAKFSLVPSGYFYLRYAWPVGLPEGASPPKKDGGRVRLEVRDVPAFVAEDYMPPENELKYRVDFIYQSHDNNEDEPDPYWKKFGKLAFRSVDAFIDEKKTMTQAVSEIVDANDSSEVKLKKIYKRTQQIRNLSFERYKSEEERKRDTPKEIKNVADMWKRGYGDAMQVTWLFLGLTRAAGFEADPVVVSTRDQTFFNKNVMNGNDLNSNVVLVKLNGQDLYLDPGVPFAPFGMLPWSATGVKGLKLDKNGGSWVEVPMPKASDSKVIRNANLKLTTTGALEGKVTVTYTGLAALRRRLDERNEDDVDRKQYLEDDLNNAIPVGIDVKVINTPAWEGSDDALVVEYELTVAGWASGAGRQWLLPVGLFAQREKNMFKHAMRVHPLYFSYPTETEDDISIALPTGFRVNNLPAPFTSGGKNLSYSTSVEEKDGVLLIRRRLSSSLLYLPQKAYSQVRDFYQQLKTRDEQQVVVGMAQPQTNKTNLK
jgi:hypothetical protein